MVLLIPTFQMRQIRLREVKGLAQSHTALHQHSKDPNSAFSPLFCFQPLQHPSPGLVLIHLESEGTEAMLIVDLGVLIPGDPVLPPLCGQVTKGPPVLCSHV